MKPIFLLLPFACASAFANHQGPQPAPGTPALGATIYIPFETPTAKITPVGKWVAPNPHVIINLARTFAEEFDKVPDLADESGKSGYWAPHLDGDWNTDYHRHMGYTWPIKRRQPAANEQQLYVDPLYGNKGVNPFSVTEGVLSIKAERTKAGNYDAFAGFGITSGLLSTHQKYAQQYGYFEISARVPAGPALLPAFWMLPVDRKSGEIDIMEAPGHLPGMISQGIHWAVNGAADKSGMQTAVPDFHKAMHTYGTLWLEDRIVFYIDRVAVTQIATKSDQKKPYYMMVNLAVGGEWMKKWVEPSDTSIPVTMEVDWIAAYSPKSAPCVKAMDVRGVEICR